MTAKEYFGQVWNIGKLIESDQRKIAELESQMQRIKSGDFAEKVQSSKTNKDILDTLIDKKNELIGKMLEEMNTLTDLQLQMFEVINSVPENNYKLVLRLRYIECMKWGEIGKAMNYTERRVKQLHGKALEAVVIPQSFH